jgi:predicted nucleotidyltransferase component of viral defense system
MNNYYAQKVELLLRMIPMITDEGVFAVHGGTAINLFLKDLPRYSVDIDLTYIPLEDRQTSISNINTHLKSNF